MIDRLPAAITTGNASEAYLPLFLAVRWRYRFGLTVGVPAAVTGLPTLATRLGGQLGVLGEAALLIGHALAAFAACDSSELPILRKTPL